MLPVHTMRTRIEPPSQQGQVGADGLGAVGGRAFAVHVEGLVGARAAQVGHCAQRDPIDAAAPRDLGDRARLHVRAHGVGEALAHRLGHLLGAEGVRRDDPPDPHRVVDEAGQGVAPGGGALGGGVVDGHPGESAPARSRRPWRRPARTHGDLWSGNVMWTPEGAVLIDPAAQGGHAEEDLAALAVFGCPHYERILAAYNEASPLADGWRERVALHQMHIIMVHCALFGRSYVPEAVSIARRYVYH